MPNGHGYESLDIWEQSQEIKHLKAENEKLKAEIAALRKTLAVERAMHKALVLKERQRLT